MENETSMNSNENEEKKKRIKIGSRGSKLAIAQAEEVKAQLQEKYPHLFFQITLIQTKGDHILDVALSKIGDKGLFTKELEVALINGDIDFAVHSLKDIPTHLPPGLTIGAITKRHIPQDCLVLNPKHKGCTLHTLPANSIIGSSSLRRVAQLRRRFPHLQFKDIRGNLNTRLNKLDEGQYDALILAVAGLSRLGLQQRIEQVLPNELCLHAVGQGALGVECRENDTRILEQLKSIHDEDTEVACEAERAFLRDMEGGCQVPIGVKTQVAGELLTLHGIVLSVDGSKAVAGEMSSNIKDAKSLGTSLAEKLKEEGAAEILKEVFQEINKDKFNTS